MSEKTGETIAGLKSDMKHLSETLKDIKTDTRNIYKDLKCLNTLPVKIDNVEKEIEEHKENHDEKINNHLINHDKPVKDHIKGHWTFYGALLGTLAFAWGLIKYFIKAN